MNRTEKRIDYNQDVIDLLNGTTNSAATKAFARLAAEHSKPLAAGLAKQNAAAILTLAAAIEKLADALSTPLEKVGTVTMPDGQEFQMSTTEHRRRALKS